MLKIGWPIITIVLIIVVGVISGIAGYMAGLGHVEEATPTYKPPEKIKVAWVYVGPIGDYGWTYMHDVGRRKAEEVFKEWLITKCVEGVSEEKAKEVIERLIGEGFTVIFTTSFDHMDATYEEALKHPDIMFFHCSGYKRAPNMATYFADLYQIYYLNGLMAGALTKTGKIGYVAAHTIPEVVRHINAFAIGAKEVGEQLGKKIEVYVIEIGAWYAPEKAREAARTLIDHYGCDVIAFTEDSPAIIELAESYYKQGKPVYVFSHYSPMYKFGPDVVVSGQLVRWEVIYIDILAKIKAGIYRPGVLENVDYWYLLNTGAVELGCEIYPNGSVMVINPKFIPMLKNIIVKDKLTGRKLSVYDLIMLRYMQMKEAPLLAALQGTAVTHKYESMPGYAPIFDPFTGPLTGYKKDNPKEKVSIPSGVRLGHDELWNMDWFVDWVIYKGKLGK